jgi:hypothetical protein
LRLTEGHTERFFAAVFSGVLLVGEDTLAKLCPLKNFDLKLRGE